LHFGTKPDTRNFLRARAWGRLKKEKKNRWRGVVGEAVRGGHPSGTKGEKRGEFTYKKSYLSSR